MIERYWGEKMEKLWKTNEMKFFFWLQVEGAVLKAREQLRQIPVGTADAFAERTWMDAAVAKAIVRRDKAIKHDLNAFIDIIRLQLIEDRAFVEHAFAIEEDEMFQVFCTNTLAKQRSASALAGYFHDGMTSYDTEEPAMALLLRDSCRVIEDGLRGLKNALEAQALEHRGLIMVGRTHGQHAQPITFGVKMLNWCDVVQRAERAFVSVSRELLVMKLSGAVGMYGTLGPDVEEKVGKFLRLTPVIATQIVSLDRRARLVNEMAVIASNVEKIARDLWIMSQTEVGEVREPFSKSQKGSSAMPHKKNPITLEKIFGLARIVRASAGSILENVATSHERDISHSSVERLAMVDAFGILDHMLTELTRVIKTMDVFPGRMEANLEMTRGVLSSQQVEMWLKRNGMPAEAAYRCVQRCCIHALEARRTLLEVLREEPETMPYVEKDRSGLAACFDWNTWVREEEHIYARAGYK